MYNITVNGVGFKEKGYTFCMNQGSDTRSVSYNIKYDMWCMWRVFYYWKKIAEGERNRDKRNLSVSGLIHRMRSGVTTFLLLHSTKLIRLNLTSLILP